MNGYGTVGCFNAGFGPINSGGYLWVNQKFPISNLTVDGANPSYNLVEPLPNPVIAIVNSASVASPMFPSGRSPAVQHVEIAGVCSLFQHGIDKVGFSHRGCPFHHYRYSNQSRI